MTRLRKIALLPLILLIGGCKSAVLNPAGDVAIQQRDILLFSTWLMLLIIVPVIALTVIFAWRYRQSNKQAKYEPDWDHSTILELVIWSAPLLIIICLGALTWLSTHLLDPYRKLGRISADQATSDLVKPLEVDVVALDWKWLFIYPQYGIATVNELAAPIDRPIAFHITSSSVMNSFFIPALAGQIYAMPGMETKLAAVMNQTGDYEGFSANYSGAGFSGMHFPFHALNDAGFAKWVASVKADGGPLSRNYYLMLEEPSENEPIRHYSSVDKGLYGAILNMCVEPGKMCMNKMSAIDAKGGLGMAGITNVMQLEYDKHVRRGTVFGSVTTHVASICSVSDARKMDEGISLPGPANTEPLMGVGLSQLSQP